MITQTNQTQIALRNLHILEQALAALRQQLMTANPDLLAVTEPAYRKRIAALQSTVSRLSALSTD